MHAGSKRDTHADTHTHTQRIALRMGREQGKKSLIYTCRAINKCVDTSVLPTKMDTIHFHFPSPPLVGEWLC